MGEKQLNVYLNYFLFDVFLFDVLIPLQILLLLPKEKLSQTNSSIYADLKSPVWTLGSISFPR